MMTIIDIKKIINKNISISKLLPLNGFALWRKVKNHEQLIGALKKRLLFTCGCGALLFLFIVIRLVSVMVTSPYKREYQYYNREAVIQKADILDRNGELLATSIITSSCYADPSVIIDLTDTVNKLSKIHGMPSADKIMHKLKDSSKHFVWLARHVHPSIQNKIMDLGLPGIHFQKDYKRIYIHGLLFSHIIGCTDIDCNGICGIEKKFNDELTVKETEDNKLILSLDLRLQTIIREELLNSINKYKAKGAHAILMKTNGEILAMVSLPDFDPNNLKKYSNSDMFNRNTLGVFEQGSILKVLTAAIALDSGSSKLNSIFDASYPINIGRFKITDFKGKERPLTLVESIVFSSNIGCAKIAQKFGSQIQKEYFKKFGMLNKLSLEIPEIGAPIVPKDWTEVTCMTVAYGYGIAVSPLQLLTIITSIVNDGIKVSPTILIKNKVEKGTRIVSSKTSSLVRELMKAVVIYGTGKKVNMEGIEIFCKTGTAYKRKGKKGYGGSSNRARLTTFVGGFPKNNPEYMLLVSLDEPQGIKETYNYATAGWNVVPTAKNIISRLLSWLSDGEKAPSSQLSVEKYIKINK
ncbi:MAG: penicillin-binding protein 2 [Alphaproteobacteria bacterium]|nr:penicillin-binding protein 2 [Alphaproteobacteria bacterium]